MSWVVSDAKIITRNDGTHIVMREPTASAYLKVMTGRYEAAPRRTRFQRFWAHIREAFRCLTRA